jgi:4-amino-4-deoxy-L-arabinose transferase-like glycosyltransferase
MNKQTIRHVVILLTLLAIALRLGWGVSRYLTDPLLVDFGDYSLYEDGAQHWLVERDFTNSLFLVRPPLFALVIVALGNSSLAVLLFNAAVGGLITPLTYGIARRLGLNERLALVAAGLYAIDFVAIAYGAALLDSIALGNFLALLMVLLLLMIPNAQRAFAYGLGAGVALVLAALARAEVYLIWTGLAAWLLVIARRQWRAIVAFAAISFAGITVWTLHNGLVFGNYSFSTVSSFTMAFYRAASVERIGSGHDIDSVYMDITYRIEEKIGNDPALATTDTRWGYHAAPADVQSALFAVSGEIFAEYPLIFVATFPVGFIRMYALDPPFIRSGEQPRWLYAAVIYNWLLFVSAVLGLGLAARQRRWRLLWCVLLIAGYFTVGTLLVKNAGMVGRERAVLTPFMTITAALTIDWAMTLFTRKADR